VLAQEEARSLNHGFIGTEHLLLGLIHEGEGIAAQALESLEISLEAVRAEVDKMVGSADSAPTGSPPFTSRAKKVLELALRESMQLGHDYIGTEHILLGIVREGEGVAAQVLVDLGADLSKVRQQVVQVIIGHEGTEAAAGRTYLPGRRARNEPSQPSAIGTVGDAWSVEVVRAGRGPDVFAGAYLRLEELVTGLGGDLDDSRIGVTSVETNQGPGLRLVVRQELEDNPIRLQEKSDGDDSSSGEAPT
jgi:ATP-dependent Clp protease ATP-binding subunit ClpC